MSRIGKLLARFACTLSREAVQRDVGLMADDWKVGNPTEEANRNLFGYALYEER